MLHIKSNTGMKNVYVVMILPFKLKVSYFSFKSFLWFFIYILENNKYNNTDKIIINNRKYYIIILIIHICI